MGKFPVAIQLFSVRDDMAADFEGTIKAIGAMGYDGVEFAGLFGNSPAEVKKICKEAGVNPISAHVGIGELLANPEACISAYAEVGCKYIAIPSMGRDCLPGSENYEDFKANVKMLSEICKKYGIALLYHNHDFEFNTKCNDECAIDVLFRDLKGYLDTEFDTCWVNVAGYNPCEYIKNYAGRTPVVHLKDFVMPGKKPAKLYQLIGVDEGAQEESKEDDAFQFRPCGYGAQHFEDIFAEAHKSGAEWVIVEQDNPSMNKKPMECAKMSIEYIKSINK